MSDEEQSQLNPPAFKSATEQLVGLNPREIRLAIAKMNAGQKKLLAVKGNAAIRKILLRDPNTDVQLAVVNSPKTNESEIEGLAGLPSTSEIVLKTIFSNPRWMKSYRIKLSLAKNPKSPMNVVQRCLRSLTQHDLKKISQDSNLRQPVTQAAQRMLKTRR